MSNDTIHSKMAALLERAAHIDTPTNEAITCIRKAWELITKYDLIIVRNTSEAAQSETEEYIYEPWFDPTAFESTAVQILQYGLQRAMTGGECKSCKGRYFPGNQIAVTEKNGATHFECRSYWSKGGQ